MTHVFVKEQSRDDHLAKHGAGDIDMILSPQDGKLVVVSQVDGVHVCGRCHEQFVHDPSHKFRPVEYNCGGFGTRILLHACCVGVVRGRGGNFVSTVERAHQARRFITKATKGMPDPKE